MTAPFRATWGLRATCCIIGEGASASLPLSPWSSWIFADDYLKHLDCVLHCAGHWPRYIGACVEWEHTHARLVSPHRRADADERLMGRRCRENRIAGITTRTQPVRKLAAIDAAVCRHSILPITRSTHGVGILRA